MLMRCSLVVGRENGSQIGSDTFFTLKKNPQLSATRDAHSNEMRESSLERFFFQNSARFLLSRYTLFASGALAGAAAGGGSGSAAGRVGSTGSSAL